MQRRRRIELVRTISREPEGVAPGRLTERPHDEHLVPRVTAQDRAELLESRNSIVLAAGRQPKACESRPRVMDAMELPLGTDAWLGNGPEKQLLRRDVAEDRVDDAEDRIADPGDRMAELPVVRDGVPLESLNSLQLPHDG